MNNLIFTLVLSLFIISCDNTLSQDLNKHDVKKTESPKEKTEFDVFIEKFKKAELPYEVCHFCDGEFDDVGEIELYFVEKFILQGNKNLAINKMDQYYYRRILNFNTHLYGLIYYKTSESIFQYVMMIFDEKGNYKDELIVGSLFGEYDTEREQSSFIYENGLITLKDLTLISTVSLTENKQKANKREIYYRIDINNGRITKLSEKSFGIIDILIDEHGNLKELD